MIVYTIAFIIVIPFVFLIAFWRAFALSTLWGWFAVPILHLPAISVPQAMALGMLLTLMTYQNVPHEKGWKAFANPFLMPLFSLGIGWILKGYT